MRVRFCGALAPALAAAAVVPALAQASDADVIRAVNRYGAEVVAADKATRASRGDPDTVQRQYDVARDFEEALRAAGSTSRVCRPLAEAALRLARAEVRQAEGYDLPDPAVTAAARRDADAAVARYNAVFSRCHAQPTALPTSIVVLRSPLPRQAFFDSISVAGTAPARSAWAVVAVDEPAPACGKGRRRVEVVRGEISLALALPEGAHDLEVRFCSPDEQRGTATVPGVQVLSPLEDMAAAARTSSPSLSARIAKLAERFRGISAVWFHDLRNGRTAAWNAEARFPAASTVKLGLLVAALDRFGGRSPVSYDIEAMATWSSNLATNRLLTQVGGSTAGGAAAAQEALTRMGATRSTFTGAYRVGTGLQRSGEEPPLISSRVTTARDLGRLLYVIHAGASGGADALARLQLTRAEAQLALGLLLSSQARADNRGLFRRALGPSTPAAQKHGWFSVVRHSAAIVYEPDGPKIVVLLTYAPNLDFATAEAYGTRLVRLLGL